MANRSTARSKTATVRAAKGTKLRKRAEATGPDTGRRRGIDRVIAILDFLYVRDEPMRPNQIAAEIQAPRSTVYEIIDRLSKAGLIEQVDGDGRVFLGRRLHYFGNSYIRHFDLMREASQMLRRLTEQTNETAQLCVMESAKYAVALMRHGGHQFRISSDIGRSVPLPWTASGPLLVSDLADDEILRLIPAADFDLPDGRRIDPAAFLRDVHLARKRGLSRLDGLMDTFIHCMAAPVYNGEGHCVATLCLVLPRSDAPRRGDQLGRILTAAAAELSKFTGGAVAVDRPLRLARG